MYKNMNITVSFLEILFISHRGNYKITMILPKMNKIVYWKFFFDHKKAIESTSGRIIISILINIDILHFIIAYEEIKKHIIDIISYIILSDKDNRYLHKNFSTVYEKII